MEVLGGGSQSLGTVLGVVSSSRGSQTHCGQVHTDFWNRLWPEPAPPGSCFREVWFSGSELGSWYLTE